MDLSHLNVTQREAVEAGDGAVLILAGPGSGKTRVLTYRVAHLVRNRAIHPWRIMAVTFTNKAAREMKERLAKILGEDALRELTIGTFHSVCARFLRVDGHFVGLERAFVIYDTDDQTALVKQIVQDMNLDDKKYRPAALLAAISAAKNELISPDIYTPATHWHEIARRVYEQYQKALLANNAVDFDDLLMKSVELLRDNPAVLDKYRRRYAHILVDEFQDTNKSQYELVKLLAGPDGNLFVVGDEDQCLPATHVVATPFGPRQIGDISVGDMVIAACGGGERRVSLVEAVRRQSYVGPLVEIITRRGHSLRATPNHILFVQPGCAAAIWDENVPCHAEERSISPHTRKDPSLLEGEEILHFVQNDNQDDFALGKVPSLIESEEMLHFVQNGNQAVLNEKKLDRLLTAPYREYVLAIAAPERDEPAVITRTADLTATGPAFDFVPAGDICLAMRVPILEGHEIIDDEVVAVKWLEYEGEIVDLNVAAVHNYIAGGIVVHNSIYSWRGADFRNVMRFRDDYRDAQVILLEQNYRSTRTILDAAQGVIRSNRMRHPKALWTENEPGVQIQVYEAYNEQEEGDYVVGEIKRLVARKQGRYGDIAVMYRTNAQSRVLEDAFVRQNIPYKLIGSTRFYERREVKDILAYLRLTHNLLDSISLRRIINTPSRGIGDKTINTLWNWAERLEVPPYTALTLLREARVAQTPPLPIPSPFDRRAETALVEFAGLLYEFTAAKDTLDVQSLLNLIIERTGYEEYLRDRTDEGEERWANVLELKTVTGDYASLPPEEGLPTFLEEVSLVADADEIDNSKEVVTLLTLHAAKGLEYSTVFLVGLEEGILPHKRSLDEGTQDALEEERRLAYVGITRARQRLYLVYAFRRTTYGASNLTEPSRFLRDIPHQLTNAHTERKAAPMPPRLGIRASRGLSNPPAPAPAPGRNSFGLGNTRPTAPTTASFRPGDKVTHTVFGDGTVLNSKPSGSDEEVEVIFKGGAKRLLGSYLKRR